MDQQKTGINRQGRLYIISAPSGAGKTSLVAALLEMDAQVEVSVSHTTRPARPGEKNGVNYHFVSLDDFEKLMSQQEFLEHAKVFDNYYGTSNDALQRRLNAGIDVILEIDWQGAQQVRKEVSDAISIFILPPSKAALRSRLEGRAQDNEEIIARRMLDASAECNHYDEYDYLIINDQFDQALIDLSTIFKANRLLILPQKTQHTEMLAKLLSY